MLALRAALEINGAIEIATIDTELLARQCEIEEKYGLSYFDSLIAASALRLNDGVLSDDESFHGSGHCQNIRFLKFLVSVLGCIT